MASGPVGATSADRTPRRSRQHTGHGAGRDPLASIPTRALRLSQHACRAGDFTGVTAQTLPICRAAGGHETAPGTPTCHEPGAAGHALRRRLGALRRRLGARPKRRPLRRLPSGISRPSSGRPPPSTAPVKVALGPHVARRSPGSSARPPSGHRLSSISPPGPARTSDAKVVIAVTSADTRHGPTTALGLRRPLGRQRGRLVNTQLHSRTSSTPAPLASWPRREARRVIAPRRRRSSDQSATADHPAGLSADGARVGL